jgi:outer membrane lipoprotein SlyB
MKKAFACMVTAAFIASSGAYAGERVLDSGLGGVSGALFFGPVGAIAGGVIGYAKGPAISRSMGLSGRHHHNRHSRRGQ